MGPPRLPVSAGDLSTSDRQPLAVQIFLQVLAPATLKMSTTEPFKAKAAKSCTIGLYKRRQAQLGNGNGQ